MMQATEKNAMVTDHLQRTLLHVGVEKNNVDFVKYLIDLGVNINARDGCGMALLSLAVLAKSLSCVHCW